MLSLVPVFGCIAFLFIDLQYAAALLLASAFYAYVAFACRERDALFNVLVISAFTLRIALVLLNQKLAFLPLQPDSFHYSMQAMKIVDNASRNLPVFYDMPVSTSVKSYSFFLAQIYSVVGEMPLFAALVNVVFGVFSAILVFKISLHMFENKRAAYFALVFSLFLPTIIAFTSYVLRDALVLFLTLLMLYHFILADSSKNHSRHIIIAIFTFLLVGIIRIQNLYLYTLFFLMFYMFKYLKSNVRIVFKIVLVSIVVLFVLTVALIYKDLLVSIATYPLRAQPLRAVGGSAYLQNMQYNSLLDVFKYLPIRFLYFTFGPFLWQANSAFLLLAALEGLIIFTAFVLTVQYFRKNRITRNFDMQIFLVLFCLVGLLANSMVDSNFGTSVRHRMNYIIFFFIFAGAYLRNVRFKIM